MYKFGNDGLKVAILHMILDSLAKDFLLHASYPTMKKLLRTYLELANHVPWTRDILEQVVTCFESNFRELIQDLAKYKRVDLGQVPAISSCVEEILVIYRDDGVEYAKQLFNELQRLRFNASMHNVDEFSGEKAKEIYVNAASETIAKGVALKPKRYVGEKLREAGPSVVDYNHIFDKLIISEPCILIVKFGKGDRIIYTTLCT